MGERVDLGLDNSYSRFCMPSSSEWLGIVWWHPDQRDPSIECGGTAAFAGTAWDPAKGGGYDRAMWAVTSREPLTLSPSLLCTRCGAHGFIVGGRWRPC